MEAFGDIKVISSWAGLYEYNTWDQNAIIGPSCEVENLVFCNGFSGHGLQQSPTAGRAVSEMIEFGEYRSIDLSVFRPSRFEEGVKVKEVGIV